MAVGKKLSEHFSDRKQTKESLEKVIERFGAYTESGAELFFFLLLRLLLVLPLVLL